MLSDAFWEVGNIILTNVFSRPQWSRGKALSSEFDSFLDRWIFQEIKSGDQVLGGELEAMGPVSYIYSTLKNSIHGQNFSAFLRLVIIP